MKKLILPLICCTLGPLFLYSNGLPLSNNFADPDYQDNNKEEVMEVVNQLFDGMRKGDSAMVSAVFDKNVRLATIDTRDNVPRFREGSLRRFLNAVGTPHENVWDEKIWDPIVEIDGNMATVWVNYAFYIGDQFSHCGVNAFQLFKSATGWKIVNLTDTRRKDNCQEP